MMQLRPYQEKSVKRITDMWHHQRGAILGHDPGLGKTAIAIRALDQRPFRKVLIVTTVSSLFNWQREFKQWQTTDRSVAVVTDSNLTPAAMPKANVIIIAYSQLSSLTTTFETLAGMHWACVIFDEAHALKNSLSNRTQAAYSSQDVITKNGTHVSSLVDSSRRFLALSGTIAPNHYGELHPHLLAAIPRTLGCLKLDGYSEFLNTFCVVREGTYGPQVLGNQNVPLLRSILKPVYHRFSREGVLKELPALTVRHYPLPATKLVLTACEALNKQLQDNGLDQDSDLAELRTIEMHLATERRALGLLKVDAVVDYADTELSAGSDDKMIVFAHHRDVLAGLFKQLVVFNPVLLQGGMSAKDRDDAIQRFQNDPDCRVFIGQIDAAGEAITLTAANRVAFAEYSWNPAKNYQAMLRAHRIGQTKPVQVDFLTVAGSLDEIIGRVVARKTKMNAELFG